MAVIPSVMLPGPSHVRGHSWTVRAENPHSGLPAFLSSPRLWRQRPKKNPNFNCRMDLYSPPEVWRRRGCLWRDYVSMVVEKSGSNPNLSISQNWRDRKRRPNAAAGQFRVAGFNDLGVVHIKFESSGRRWKGLTSHTPRAPEDFGKRGVYLSAVGAGNVIAGEELSVMEGDVVEYYLVGSAGGEQEAEGNGRQTGVGVIMDMISDSDGQLCQIEPLCQEDPGSKEWIHDELQPEITVPIGQVRVLQAWYSQRMVPDRISNPHGEHAESLWILE